MPVHEEVIAFCYVRAADVFDTATMARRLEERLLASLFTTLTDYIILPARHCHILRQFLKAQTKSGRRPNVSHLANQGYHFFCNMLATQKLTHLTSRTDPETFCPFSFSS